MAASNKPPYLQIVEDIRRRISQGLLSPGDRVPSTREITREWGVAMATATKTLATLRQEGAVQAVPGRRHGSSQSHAGPAGRLAAFGRDRRSGKRTWPPRDQRPRGASQPGAHCGGRPFLSLTAKAFRPCRCAASQPSSTLPPCRCTATSGGKTTFSGP